MTTASIFENTSSFKPKTYTHMKVERSVSGAIVLPDGMSCDSAIEWLEKFKADEETEVQFLRAFDFHPDEGAVALAEVLKECFGWVEMKAVETFFGKILPKMIQIQVGVGQVVTVPWGKMGLPGITGSISTAVKGGPREENGQMIYDPLCFVLSGTVIKRDVMKLEEIARRLEARVRSNSIYRGKAIDSDRKFIDLSRVSENDLIFERDVMDQVEASIFTPIEHSAACRSAGVPLKRGVLLEGPYGTGKTLTAYVSAKRCISNGWTFIYGHAKDKLAQIITFAKQYQPAVVFMEDIDVEAGGASRDVRMNDVLNTLDGILTKDNEIMVILTSNHADRINRALLRPGRLDAVIHVDTPGPDATEKLLRKYGRGLIPADADLSLAVQECSGMIPATIREVVERAKLFVIRRTKSPSIVVEGVDLQASAKMLSGHLKLMRAEVVPTGRVRILAEVSNNGKVSDAAELCGSIKAN